MLWSGAAYARPFDGGASRVGTYFSRWLEVQESVDRPSGCKSEIR